MSVPNPPFRELPPMSGLETSTRFRPLWEDWFIKTTNQVKNNATDITDLQNEIDTVNALLQAIFHVGAIFETTNRENPATYFGFGTWELFGKGRSTVCIDYDATDFDQVEETGQKTATAGAVNVYSYVVVYRWRRVT